MHQYPEVLQATTIIGKRVLNRSGEQLGTLKELVIDLEDGRVAYAVLSFGGFLGKGDKLFAIPWEAFALNPKDHTFLLDVEKEVLRQAPGFDKDQWPDGAQYEAGWLFAIYEYYGYSPYWMTGK